MSERPKWGTAPIRCGRTKCKFRGYETDFRPVKKDKKEVLTKYTCPLCGCDNYMFMTEREIKAWERRKLSASSVPSAVQHDGYLEGR